VNHISVHKGLHLCKQVTFLVFGLSRTNARHHQQTAADNGFPVQNTYYHPLLFNVTAEGLTPSLLQIYALYYEIPNNSTFFFD
jgi:hypothetical protein